MNAALASERLHNQCLVGTSHRTPADVVSWFGAIQAQEYGSAAWGIGLRLRTAATAAAVDRAFDAGHILRTHVMRPTWHFIAPADIRWMLQLTKHRVQKAMASYYRRFEIDSTMNVRAAAAFEKATGDGKSVTRAELGLALARAGIAANGFRFALLTIYAELEGILCSGPRAGKQMTYAALSARAPREVYVSRDQAIGELTMRFYRSHGPATIRDFMWWSGLTSVDAKRGVEIAGAQSTVIDGLTYWTVGVAGRRRRGRLAVQLLPNYDEYLVAYRDLKAVPRKPGVRGFLQRAVIASGEVVGTWTIRREAARCIIALEPYRRLTRAEQIGVQAAVARYGRFQQRSASLAG